MAKKKLNRTIALTANFTVEEHKTILNERQLLGFTNTEYIRNKVLNPDLLAVNHVDLINVLSILGHGMGDINFTLKETVYLFQLDNKNSSPLHQSIDEYISVQKMIEHKLTEILRTIAKKK